MTNLLMASIAASYVVGAFEDIDYLITVPAGVVDADLTDFPLMIDLSLMPASFWANVNSTGGNIRAYNVDGSTMIPHDVTYIDTDRQLGRMFVKKSLTTASATNIILRISDVTDTKLAVDNANGRNNVWNDYEVVWMFPDTNNRSGNTYTQSYDDTGPEPRTDWIRTHYYEFVNNPHQGIACDGTTAVTTIDTNELRRYLTSDLTTHTATNADPVGDTNTGQSETVLNHASDGCFISGELWLPINEWPVSGGTPVEHFAKFNGTTLAYVSAIDVSSTGRPHSSICYDGTNIWATDYTDGTSIMRYNTSGVLQETVTLSTTMTNPQGIEYVDGVLYIACEDTNDATYAFETDGTYIGEVYRRPTAGIQEGISYDGTLLYSMDGDGDLVILKTIADKMDYRKLHYDHIQANIAPISQTWTFATSVYWSVQNGDYQHAFLSYAGGTNDSRRASLAYDDGPDVIAMWNSSNGWVSHTLNPDGYETFRVAGSHNGTTQRKVWANGTSVTDTGISARPTYALGNNADFVVNASRQDNHENGEGYYQNIWLRHEEMSDAWMLADYEQMHDNSNFISIVEVGTETPSSTHWKIDNITYFGGNVQLRGMGFIKDKSYVTNVTSVSTNIGDVTSDIDRNPVDDTSFISGVYNTHTEFVWVFDVDVSPDEFYVWCHESDTDRIDSCDISYSTDGGTTYLKVGTYTNVSKTFPDGQVLNDKIGVDDFLMTPKQTLTMIEGRIPNGVSVIKQELIVITKPAP